MKNRMIALQAGVILLLFSSLLAQAPDTLWTKKYGGTDWDFGRSIESVDSLNYVIAGYSHSFGNGYELYLIKVDENGDTLWMRTLGGPNDEEAFDIKKVPTGDLVIAGWTSSYGSGLRDAYLVLTNENGDTIWTRTYGGAARDIAYGVYPTSDGGFIMVGATRSSGNGLSDLYLVKANAQGDSMWAKTFGGSEQDFGYSVLETPDGGFIAVGFTESSGSGMGDMYIIRTDASGDSIWTRTFGGSADDRALKIKPANDSGFIITGYSSSFGSGGTDVYMLKISNQGDSVWAFTYGGLQDDCGYDIENAANGGYIVCGITRSFGEGNEDVYLLRLSEQGDTNWTQTYGGSSDDGAAAVIEMPDHGLLIAGKTYSFGTGGYDVWLIRTEPITGITEREDNLEWGNRKGELTAIPNPFFREIEIQLCGVSEYGSIGEPEIQIYNVSGRKVRDFILYPSSFILGVTWDGRDEVGKVLPPGIYFLKADGKFVAKVVKVR